MAFPRSSASRVFDVWRNSPPESTRTGRGPAVSRPLRWCCGRKQLFLLLGTSLLQPAPPCTASGPAPAIKLLKAELKGDQTRMKPPNRCKEATTMKSYHKVERKHELWMKPLQDAKEKVKLQLAPSHQSPRNPAVVSATNGVLQRPFAGLGASEFASRVHPGQHAEVKKVLAPKAKPAGGIPAPLQANAGGKFEAISKQVAALQGQNALLRATVHKSQHPPTVNMHRASVARPPLAIPTLTAASDGSGSDLVSVTVSDAGGVQFSLKRKHPDAANTSQGPPRATKHHCSNPIGTPGRTVHPSPPIGLQALARGSTRAVISEAGSGGANCKQAAESAEPAQAGTKGHSASRSSAIPAMRNRSPSSGATASPSTTEATSRKRARPTAHSATGKKKQRTRASR